MGSKSHPDAIRAKKMPMPGRMARVRFWSSRRQRKGWQTELSGSGWIVFKGNAVSVVPMGGFGIGERVELSGRPF